MTVRSIVLPLRLGVHLRFGGRARLGRARADERIAQMALACLVVLFAAALAYTALLGAGTQRDEVLTRIFLALFSTPLALTLIPVMPPIGRCAPTVPSEWPLSAVQRGLADIGYALAGFWSALYLAVVGAAIMASPPDRILPGVAAGVAGAVVLVTACALTRFLIEWLMPRVAQVALALALLALLWLLAARQAYSTSVWMAVPAPVIVDVFRDAASPAESWRAAGLLAAQGGLLVALYLASFRLGHWRWRERQEHGRFWRGSNAVARLQPLALLVASRLAVRAVFTHQLTYLARAPRVWFLQLYAPIFGLIFLRQLANGWSPPSKAFFLTMWMSGGSCLFLYNLFAFDGRGIGLWQHAPVSDRDLMLGKNLAVFVAAAPSAILCGSLVTWQTTGDLRLGAASVLLMGYFLVVHAAIGNFASVAFPAPLQIRNMTRNALSGPATLVLLLTLVVSAGVAALVWGVTAGVGSLAVMGAQGLVLLAMWPVSRRLLASAARHLSRERERLVAGVMESPRA